MSYIGHYTYMECQNIQPILYGLHAESDIFEHNSTKRVIFKMVHREVFSKETETTTFEFIESNMFFFQLLCFDYEYL